MKRLVSTGLALALLVSCVSNQGSTVCSPDGSLQLSVLTEDGVLKYSVSKDGECIVEPSRLGFELMGGNVLGIRTEILSVEHEKTRTSWETVWGEERVIEDRHNGMTVHTANLDVEVRVFDDGLGFRYIFPEHLGSIDIREELTEFRFAREDHKIWWMPRSEPYYEA